MQKEKFKEAVILVDADYVDRVAFDLTVNFERMLMRRIPRADLAQWLVCVALDGSPYGGEPGTAPDGGTQVIFLHRPDAEEMKNFAPGRYADIDGQAFRDHLGEFSISALPVEAVTTKADFFIDTLQLVCAQKEVRRVMVIPGDSLIPAVRQTLNRIDDDNKRITLFAMQPLQGGNFRQEILGYSLMAAMGIRSEEILGNEK